MGYGNPKLVYAKKKGFRKSAYSARMYGGRPSDDAKRRFYAAPYGIQETFGENDKQRIIEVR